MRTRVFLMMFMLGFFAHAEQEVTVYDISVEPDSPNKKVTVQYRLSETASGLAHVGVEISSDAGATWSVPSDTFYPGSDIGAAVRADGSLQQFVWDARADWNHQYSTQMMMRLRATTSDIESSIYFIANGQNTLYRMSLDGSGLAAEATGVPHPENMFADQNKIYINDWNSGGVRFYDLTLRAGFQMLHHGPGWGGQGMAHDPEAGLWFVGRYYAGVFSLNQNHSSAWNHLVTSSQISPLNGQRGQMGVDPVSQHVYFRTAYNGTCDNCRLIWRVNYDGTQLVEIIPANQGDALAVDYENGFLYFSDGMETEPGDTVLMRANLDGTGAVQVWAAPLSYGFIRRIELDADNGVIYVLLKDHVNAPADRAIARVNTDGSDFQILRELPYSLYGGVEGFTVSIAP